MFRRAPSVAANHTIPGRMRNPYRVILNVVRLQTPNESKAVPTLQLALGESLKTLFCYQL
jgi:hypothetical protein